MVKSVQAVTQAADKMQASIGDFATSSTKNVSLFQTAVATMAGFVGGTVVTAAFSAITNAAKSMAGQFIKGAQAAGEEEAALLRLANSLALNGRYTQASMKSLQDFASEMEETAGVGSELVASNLAVLESLTKLDAEGLKVAQKAAIDMSAALGKDLNTTTEMIAKGVNGNTLAFQKMGIEIEVGSNKAQNLSNILKALSNQSGAAQGAFKTFNGTMTGVSEAWEDVTKAVAGWFTQNPVIISMLGEIAKIFRELSVSLNGNATEWKTTIASIVIAVFDLAAGVTQGMDWVIRAFTGAVRTISLAGQVIVDSFQWVISKLTGGEAGAAFDETKAKFEALTKTFSEDTTVGKLSDAFTRVADAGRNAFGEIAKQADVILPTVNGVAQAVAQLSDIEKQRLENLKAFAVALADQQAALFNMYEEQVEMLQAQAELEIITEQEKIDALLRINDERHAAELAALEEANSRKLISEEQYTLASKKLQSQQLLDTMKLQADQKKLREATQKEQLQNLNTFFGQLSQLQQSSNSQLFAIGKAAAMAQATMDGIIAVQGALKWGTTTGGPALGFAFASLIGIAQAQNVAKIAGIGLKSGMTEIPRSASGANGGDNFPAMLMPGERVVDAGTNQDLKAFLKNGGGGSMTITININNSLPASREAGAAMVEAINESINSGGLKIAGTV